MSASDPAFLARFEAALLPPEEWDHRAHLRMAFLQLRRHGWPTAIRPVREGIQRLNQANGVGDGAAQGYHETLTLCWLRLVCDALERSDAAGDFELFIARHPELLSPECVLRHYSRERLRDPRARREFVLPDREPLPALAASPRPGRGAAVRNGSAPGKDAGAEHADHHDRQDPIATRAGSRRTPA